MPAHKILPGDKELEQMLRRGWTHKQIAEHIELTTGQRVSRSAVSVAIYRAGLTGRRPRYDREIPWRVKIEHQQNYDLLMLRLAARERHGKPMRDDERSKLEHWRRQLEAQDAVVHYQPDTSVGFWWVKRRPDIDQWLIYEPDESALARARA